MANQFEIVAKFKINTKAENFCSEKTRMFEPFLRYTYSLKFEETPDYNKLRFILKKILLDRDLMPDNTFDWHKHSNSNKS